MENNEPDAGNKNEPPPIGALITVSLFFPGGGQLANGDKTKGWIIIGVVGVLTLVMFHEVWMVGYPIYKAWVTRINPDITPEYTAHFKNLVIIFIAMAAIWLGALVDTMVVANNRMRNRGK